MTLILGEQNSNALYDVWNFLKDKTPVIVNEYADKYDEEPIENPNNPTLNNKIVNLFRRNELFAPYKDELALEQTGKVLLALRAVTDSPTDRQKNHSPSRLKKCLNYESILNILRETTKITPNNDDISLSIDFCVDHGLAVPKIIEENGTLFRAFYCGEDEDNQSLLQFKGALHIAYTNFLRKKGSRHLTTFEFQKLCVALKDTVLWIPISTGPYKYGFTPTVGHQQLTDWLCSGVAAPFFIKREENRDVIVPNPDYRCIVNPTWDSPVKEREFFDSFDYTASAFCKISEESKLLLTTCRTHRHTFNAIAFELWAWIGDVHNSFESFLTSINKSFLNKGEIDQDALDALFWSIRYISEAWKKHHIFFLNISILKKSLRKDF